MSSERTGWSAPEPSGSLRSSRASRFDGVALAVIVGASTLPYVGGLGFYSDDWAFLGVLTNSMDRSLFGLVTEQAAWSADLEMRPTQLVYQAMLFRAFGTDPLGYHLVNASVLILVAVTLHRVLLELRTSRPVAVAIPAVYALLPSYSTDRFWFAAFGYLLSVATFLLALRADLRAGGAEGSSMWRWKGVALTALTVAAFGFEVVLPLLVLNVVLPDVVSRRQTGLSLIGRIGPWRLAVFHGSTIAVGVAAALYKASVAEGIGPGWSLLRHVAWVSAGALSVHLGTFGIGLPHTVAWSIRPAGIAGCLIGVGIGIAIFFLLARASPSRSTSRRTWYTLASVGAIGLLSGYLIFLFTARLGFSSLGISNRVGIVAAAGSAMVIVATIGWSSTLLRSEVARRRWFASGIALVCAGSVIVTVGLASFWIESDHVQTEILARIREDVEELPRGSTLLVSGVCPYEGPAVVFESSWDLRGALRTMYADPTLEADVTTGDIEVETRGVRTRIYRAVVLHPYGEETRSYDVRSGLTSVLRDERSARRALSESLAGTSCPSGRPGYGTIVLPFDRVLGWIETRLQS